MIGEKIGFPSSIYAGNYTLFLLHRQAFFVYSGYGIRVQGG
jgi:hypothetical protein